MSETLASSENSQGNYNSGSVDLDQYRGDFSINSYDPLAGGGTWYYGFERSTHYSSYDHRRLTHRSSVSNSRTTIRSRWHTKDEGFAHSEIDSTIWGNRANWATTSDDGVTPIGIVSPLEN